MTHGGGPDPHGLPPMYWLMGIGLGIGIFVVILFEYFSHTLSVDGRKNLFQKLSGQEELHPEVSLRLESSINGPQNIWLFWTGGQLKFFQNKENFINVYDNLTIISALLWAVAVTFFVANAQGNGAGDHFYGMICCIANCAFWMGTLSSAFFAVICRSCEDSEFELLKSLYGNMVLAFPFIMLTWGSVFLFLIFILFFKNTVDFGFACSLCLGACLTYIPLFLHYLHRLSWGYAIVHTQQQIRHRSERSMTRHEVARFLQDYVQSKPANILSMDKEEFLESLNQPEFKLTSTTNLYATNLFDTYVKEKLKCNENEDSEAHFEKDVKIGVANDDEEENLVY